MSRYVLIFFLEPAADNAKAAEKPQEAKKGGKKYLRQKLKEKEAQKLKEAEERRLKEENKTPEEKMADRLLAQKLAEESELEIVKGQFSKFYVPFHAVKY